jgi:hypothetical protein
VRRANIRAAYEADLSAFAASALQLHGPALQGTDTEAGDATRRLLSAGTVAATSLVLDYFNQLRAEGRSTATINRRVIRSTTVWPSRGWRHAACMA